MQIDHVFPVNVFIGTVMDGARLFPRRDPANGALMVFQSEALNYSVELTAPAHSWEGSTALLLWYQNSEFDLSAVVGVRSVILSQYKKEMTTKQCHWTTHDCLSSHTWTGLSNFSSVVLMWVVCPCGVCNLMTSLCQLLKADWDNLQDMAHCLTLAVFSVIWPWLLSSPKSQSLALTIPILFHPLSLIKKLSFVIVLIPQFLSHSMGSIMLRPSNSSKGQTHISKKISHLL